LSHWQWRVGAYQFVESKHTHGYSDVSHAAVAFFKVLDVLADFDSDSHGLVARDELRQGR
jgi:hypothetical protein